MTKRLTVLYNQREPEHNTIKDMLEQTKLDLRFIPTSGCYTLWARAEDNSIEAAYYGPTAVKNFLTSFLESKDKSVMVR